MRPSLIATTLCLAASAAVADTRIDFQEEGSRRPANVMYLTGGHVRMDVGDAGGQYMIFDAKAQTITSVDPKQRSYTVIDQATIAQIGAKVSDARKQMDAAMANMPPEQRAQMEKMMGGMAPSAPKAAYTRTGKRSKFGGYDCEIVNYAIGAERGEMCVASAGALSLPASDVKTLEQLSAFADRMSTQVLQMGMGDRMNVSELGGFPVRSKHEGDPAQIVQRVSHDSLPSSLFTPPSDFERKALLPPGR